MRIPAENVINRKTGSALNRIMKKKPDGESLSGYIRKYTFVSIGPAGGPVGLLEGSVPGCAHWL